MGKIVKTLQVKTGNDEPIPLFWWQLFCQSLAWSTGQKQHQRKTNKCNIWGPLYTPKVAGSVGGQRRRKYHAMKKAFIENLNQIIYTRMYDYGDT